MDKYTFIHDKRKMKKLNENSSINLEKKFSQNNYKEETKSVTKTSCEGVSKKISGEDKNKELNEKKIIKNSYEESDEEKIVKNSYEELNGKKIVENSYEELNEKKISKNFNTDFNKKSEKEIGENSHENLDKLNDEHILIDSNENKYKRVLDNLDENKYIYEQIIEVFDKVLEKKSYKNESNSNSSDDFSEKNKVHFSEWDELLDDLNNNSLKEKISNSTLSLFSSRSDTSSIYDDNDNLIKIYIGQLKLHKVRNDSILFEKVFCVSYFVYEDPLETFSLFQGINWLPELQNRCTFLSSIEYIPRRNIKIGYSDLGVNINQYINLKSRINEHLNVLDNGIVYVFISIIGVNLKEFEKYYSNKIAKKYRTVNFHNANFVYNENEENSHTVDEDINNSETINRNKRKETYKIHINAKEIIKEIKDEIEEEISISTNKKIIQEKNYKDYLKILGSSIIPINTTDKNALKKESSRYLINIKKNYDNYNIYPHNTIRLILNNYLDSFKENKKVNLFHLINKYEKELISIGKIKLFINAKNKSSISIPDELTQKNAYVKGDSSDVNKMMNRILKHEELNKSTKKEHISDDSANSKYSNSKTEIEEEPNCTLLRNKESNTHFNKLFNYIEKNLNKIYDEEEENIFKNELFKAIFDKLELSKKKEKKVSSFNSNEIVCSHLIIKVHYISDITLNLSTLQKFIDMNYFYIIVYWDEEGKGMENIKNIKLRKSRTIELNSKKDIGLNYYFLTNKENDLNYKMGEEDNIVNLKLNFNSSVILPYNYNVVPQLNIILFHNDVPLLELTENIVINNNIPFNEGVKIKKKLKVHENYKHKIYNFFKQKSDPYVELSFYKHPKNSTFFSCRNYRLLYREKMKASIDDNIHSSYSAPMLNKKNVLFLFFDDFQKEDKFDENREKALNFLKNDFFLPVMENQRTSLENSRRSVRENKNKEEMLVHREKKNNIKKNTNLSLMKNEIIDFAIAEGPGLKGGEINNWLSFKVYTKNYKKKNIYCGKFVNIRLQIEPFGYLKSEYNIHPYKNDEVNKNTINCYTCNKKLMGFEHFCFKPFNDIHETVDYNVEDLKNGTYNVLYKINKVGKKILYIYCDGINIIGSPYEINMYHSCADSKSSKIIGKGATRCLGTPILNLENFFYNKKKSHLVDIGNHEKTEDINFSYNIQSKLLQQKIDEFEEKKKQFGNMITLASDNIQKLLDKNSLNQTCYTHQDKNKEKQNNSNENEEKKETSNTPNEKKEEEEQQNAQNEIEYKTDEQNKNTNNSYIDSLNNNEETLHLNIEEETNQKDTSSIHQDTAYKRKKYADKKNVIFNDPEYYDEINGNVIKLDKINNEKYKKFLKNTEVINNFTVVLCDQNGERISIGNENIKVVGKNGAHIKSVIDNNDGSYTIEYICYVKKEKKKKLRDIKKEDILSFYNEFLFQENKYFDNFIIKEYEKRFNQLSIHCEINVYVNEIEIFGSPLKPIIMNLHNVLELYNLYDQFTYSGLLLKNFEHLLDSNNYQSCIDNLCAFYKDMVDVEDLPSKNLSSNIIHDNDIENENFFFKIPLNISELRKGALIENKLPIHKLSYRNIKKYEKLYKNNLNEEKNIFVQENNLSNKNTFINCSKTEDDKINYDKNMISNNYEDERIYNVGTNLCNKNTQLIINNIDEENTDFLNKWLYMYTHREKLSNLNEKYDLSMNLAYSLSNIILHHLIYLKKYKYFVNFKQYENDLLQNNILSQFKNILEDEYNKMFAYQTNNIIKYCNKIGDGKFSSLEELIKVYKSIAYELRKLKKNELADDFDKCCENMCEELYLGNIESNLKQKEVLLDKYEKIMNEKIEKADKIKNSLKKYEDKKVDLEKISKLCTVKTNKEVQTNDYLSYKTGFLSSLAESRNATNENSEINKKILDLVRKSWKNSSTYDIYTTILNTLKNCPRLKVALEETFNYYSCSFKKNNKTKDLEFKRIQEIKHVGTLDNLKKIELQEENYLSYNDMNDSYLTYNAYFSLLNDLKLNKYFLNDSDNVLWLFEKFSIEHNSFKNLYNPYGLLRVIPKYLFIAFIRELSYLNLLYVLAQFVIENNENIKLYLNVNHPSRLSSFHYFIKYHFSDFYDRLCNLDNFQNFKQNLIEPYEVDKTIKDNSSADNHINLLELENYFNNELPLIVKHKNFSKTFPLLFDYYSKLSMNLNKTNNGKEVNNMKQHKQFSKEQTKKDKEREKKEETNIEVGTETETETETETDQNLDDKKYVSISIFIKILREFGIVPYFFDNKVVKQILNSSMKNKNKLSYDDFSYAIILSICECVKKNIMTQYNMLRSSNNKNSKIEAEKILNYNYVANEAKELIYLFGFSDMHIVKSKISI